VKRFLPVVLAVLGLAIGTGTGLMLKPPAEKKANGAGKTANSKKPTDAKPAAGDGSPASDGGKGPAKIGAVEFVKLNNQFVVPIIEKGKVAALVVMSLTIEIKAGKSDIVYNLEPKLRDAFLQVLFNHANSGGFSGEFTSGPKMTDLRSALLATAKKTLGPLVSRVLVTEIVRQDV